MVHKTRRRRCHNTFGEPYRYIGLWMTSFGRNYANILRWLHTSPYAFSNIELLGLKCRVLNREWRRKLKISIRWRINSKNYGIEWIL